MGEFHGSTHCEFFKNQSFSFDRIKYDKNDTVCIFNRNSELMSKHLFSNEPTEAGQSVRYSEDELEKPGSPDPLPCYGACSEKGLS